MRWRCQCENRKRNHSYTETGKKWQKENEKNTEKLEMYEANKSNACMTQKALLRKQLPTNLFFRWFFPFSLRLHFHHFVATLWGEKSLMQLWNHWVERSRALFFSLAVRFIVSVQDERLTRGNECKRNKQSWNQIEKFSILFSVLCLLSTMNSAFSMRSFRSCPSPYSTFIVLSSNFLLYLPLPLISIQFHRYFTKSSMSKEKGFFVFLSSIRSFRFVAVCWCQWKENQRKWKWKQVKKVAFDRSHRNADDNQ